MELELIKDRTKDPQGTHRFLIVDDAAPVRETLRRYLEDQGSGPDRIFTAGTGKEAVELFREHRPCVVLLDLMLPDIDGEEVANAIFEEDPDAKIVVVTGWGRDDEASRRVMAMGAFDFLPKPVRRRDLEHVLTEIAVEDGKFARIR